MTKIRCQKCGGENLHSEGAMLIICNDCGNKTYVIPEVAVTEIDSPINSDIVTIRYNRRQTDCPRQSICVNDRMEQGAEPCKICNVVRHQYQLMSQEMVNTFEKRQAFLEAHPELMDEVKDEQEMFQKISRQIGGEGGQDEEGASELTEATTSPKAALKTSMKKTTRKAAKNNDIEKWE